MKHSIMDFLDNPKDKRFMCKKCESTNTYTLVGGTRVCRRCGSKSTTTATNKNGSSK